ncbi:CopG family transcriptional regulator [Methylobacterium sp. 2A]|jgi:predicted transcriptional regulator|nr:CopG family transcriptional regulator [Methylobacterium sp. 2A]
MADLSTLTAELPPDVPAKLARLSERTGRDSSAIVGEAIAGYVDHELAIIEEIEAGLAASRAGRVVDHDAVMRKARDLIEAARAGQ